MENKIKITKNLKFEFQDLMKVVDRDHEFTLRDILRACVNSKIPLVVLGEILHCQYLKNYWEEAESRPFTGLTDDRKMEYLEVYWRGSKETYEGKRCDSHEWEFRGIGKEGYIPKDILKYGKWKKGEKKHYRQPMAIELSPMYTLADYPIKIGKGIHITDYDVNVKNKSKKDDYFKTVDMNLEITLIELLYAIFWELSFSGSPEKRDSMKEDLYKIVNEIEKASAEGRLDEITVPWKKVKKDLEKKIKSIKKSKVNKEK